MELRRWEELPRFMQTEEVAAYHQVLVRRRASLFWKRWSDFLLSSLLLFLLWPLMAAVAVWIRLDSEGPALFMQKRVTQYGRVFWILKFRTMEAERKEAGSLVTLQEDRRITRAGRFLRCFRLDELPQLFNIWKGEMSFVGTRPEVPQYVKHYTKEMYATLLLPAGLTSEASIRFKDEAAFLAPFLAAGEDADEAYIGHVLPVKMAYNLKAVGSYSFWGELWTMARTVFAVLR